jgi:molecular chaperone DnaJ
MLQLERLRRARIHTKCLELGKRHQPPRLRKFISLLVWLLQGSAVGFLTLRSMQLARKYHPDTNPDKNAREKFQEIQEAYDVRRTDSCTLCLLTLFTQVLKDDKKRAAYDKYGSAAQQPGFDADAFEQMRRNPFASAGGFGGFSGMGGMGGMGGGFRSGGAEDLFSSLFGGAFGGARAQANMRGDDLDTTVNISFMDACKGTTRTVHTTPVSDCNSCSGSGLKAGAKRSTCGVCHGTGQQRYVIDGGFQVQSTCTSCGGAGTTIPRGSACNTCDGVGKLRKRESVTVDIPPGTLWLQVNGRVLIDGCRCRRRHGLPHARQG